MPAIIPLIPSANNYRLRVPIGGPVYLFDVRWNSRESAWYFDLSKENETPIASSIKMVVGQNISAPRYTDAFFKIWMFTVIDTSGKNLDPAYDDLGARVQLILASPFEFV